MFASYCLPPGGADKDTEDERPSYLLEGRKEQNEDQMLDSVWLRTPSALRPCTVLAPEASPNLKTSASGRFQYGPIPHTAACMSFLLAQCLRL